MKIDYRLLMDIVKNEKIISAKDIYDVITFLSSDMDEEYIESNYSDTIYGKMRDVAKLFSNNAIIIEGNANDYHNIAVAYARSNMMDCALAVLEKGKIENPNSIDLLADTILYGIEGSRRDKSKKAFEQIKKAGKCRWNWRVYSFTLDFFIDKANTLPAGKTLDSIKKEAFQLTDEYVVWAGQNPQYLDRAYFDKAKVYSAFGSDLCEEQILLEGIKAAPIAPLCLLRLTDIYENKNKYDEMLGYLNKCQIAINKPQPDVDASYVYLRMGMTKASKLLSETIDGEYGGKEKEIYSIYKDFDTVINIQNASPNYKQSAKSIKKILEVQTGIEDAYENNKRMEFI